MKNTKQPNLSRQNSLFRGALKLLTKTIPLLLLLCSGLASAVHAEDITYKKDGGWNLGIAAQDVELESGARYLLSFKINCTDLDKYGAVFLITKGSSGAMKIASVYPGVFNEFIEMQKVVEVAKDAVDAKLHFGSHGSAAYTVKDVEVVALDAMSLELVLPDENSMAIFDPSEGCHLDFSVNNQSGKDYKGPLNVQVIDMRTPSKVYRDLGRIDTEMKGNASNAFALGAFKAPSGLYALRVFNDSKSVFMQYNIAMSLPNKRWEDDEADRVFFGLHMPHYALWEFPSKTQKLRGAFLLEHIGVAITRIKIPWSEDASGKLNFHTLDEALAILKERNIQVLAEVPNTIPRQYTTPPKPPTAEALKKKAPWLNLEKLLSPSGWQILSVRPSDMPAMARFATALGEKLKAGGVKYIELGNEPDWWDYWLGDFQDYSDTYTVKYDAMKQVDPDFKFMNGGLTMLKAVDEQFLQKLLVAQTERLDAVAFHSYDRPCEEIVGEKADGSLTFLAELKKVMEDTGVNKPIWMSEGNVYTQNEYTVAKEIAKKFAIYKLNGVQNYTYYRTITDDHLGFQIMTKGFEPALAAVAYSTAVRFLRNKTASRAQLPEGFVGVKFDNDVLLVWSDGDNCAERKEFKLNTSQPVAVYDFLGAKIAESKSERLQVSLGSDPVFIVSE